MNEILSVVSILFEPTIFTVLLVLIAVVIPAVYVWNGASLYGGLSASSLILVMISPLFFWVYEVTLVEYLLLLLALSIPFLFDMFLTALKGVITENNRIISQSIQDSNQKIEDLDDRLKSIETDLLKIKLQTDKDI